MGEGCTYPPIMYLSTNSVLWISFVLCQVWVVFGVFGNVLSFRVLGYCKSRRNQSSGFYLRALAIADCCTLIGYTFPMSLQMMLRPAARLGKLHPIVRIVNSYPACNIRMWSGYATSLVATYIIVLFSIERSLVVLNPFKWMQVFTLKKSRMAIVVLIVVSCIVCSPSLKAFDESEIWVADVQNGTQPAVQLVKYKANGICNRCTNCSSETGAIFQEAHVKCVVYSECRINLDLFKPFVIFQNFLQSILSLAITAVCNAIIINVMRKRSSDRVSEATNSDENQDWQVTKRLIFVSSIFIVLNLPLSIYQFITFIMTGSYCNTAAANTLTITLMLNSGNFAVNFFIYCISEHQFRKLVIAVIKCKRHRLNRLMSYMNEPANRKAKKRGKSPAADSRSLGATTSSTRSTKDVAAAAAAVNAEANPLIEQKAAEAAQDYVRARREAKEAKEDQERRDSCGSCSLVKDDWSSSMFNEAGKYQAEEARWSEIVPE